MVSEILTSAMGFGQFGMTFYLVLEVAQIRRDLERSDEVETTNPPLFDLLPRITGGRA